MMSGVSAKAPERGKSPASKDFPRAIYGVLSVTLFVVISEFVVYSYVSVIITGSLLTGVPLLSAALFAYGFGAVTGNAACGFLTDRFGPYKVLIAVIGAQLIVLVALVGFGHHGALTVLIAFLWGNASYMYLVPIQHRLLDLVHAVNLALLVACLFDVPLVDHDARPQLEARDGLLQPHSSFIERPAHDYRLRANLAQAANILR